MGALPTCTADAMTTFAIAIPHTPWVDERRVSLHELRGALTPLPPGAEYRVFGDKAPNHVWSEELWTWLAGTNATHVLQLQDDVRVCPEFWGALQALVAAHPDEVIGLETVHPLAKYASGHRWVTTSDGLVGVGYVMPRAQLVQFLKWRHDALKPGAPEQITEDTLIGLWCLHTKRRIYHPVPTIIDHNVNIKSTYNNDAHGARRPEIRWDTIPGLTDEEFCAESFWNVPPKPLHLGRMYGASPFMLRQWLRVTPNADEFNEWLSDGDGPARRLLGARRKGRAPTPETTPRVLVCTINRGAIHYAHHTSLLTLAHNADAVGAGFEIADCHYPHADIVRARSRAVNTFLHETDATHLLFVDADIAFEPVTVAGMLEAKRDFVGCPYPRRDMVEWAKVNISPDAPPEAFAYYYPVVPLPEGIGDIDLDNCVEVSSLPLGMALLSRKMLKEMQDAYRMALHFSDEVTPQRKVPSVALFMLAFANGMGPERGLLSEDYSFCQRYRQIGGKVWMYLGLGSPVDHYGEHRYRGHVEAFGLKREKVR
jgi:hypothetical protein